MLTCLCTLVDWRPNIQITLITNQVQAVCDSRTRMDKVVSHSILCTPFLDSAGCFQDDYILSNSNQKAKTAPKWRIDFDEQNKLIKPIWLDHLPFTLSSSVLYLCFPPLLSFSLDQQWSPAIPVLLSRSQHSILPLPTACNAFYSWLYSLIWFVGIWRWRRCRLDPEATFCAAASTDYTAACAQTPPAPWLRSLPLGSIYLHLNPSSKPVMFGILPNISREHLQHGVFTFRNHFPNMSMY